MKRYAPAYPKTPLILLPVFAVCLSFALITTSSAFAKKTKQSLQNNQIKAASIILQGFPEDADIHYTILSSHGLIEEGVTTTNDTGSLVVNYNLAGHEKASYYAYDLYVSVDGNYKNILMRHNLETGVMTTSAKGLEEFSEVSITTTNKQRKTKTDWAGIFFEKEKLNKKDQSYQLALQGFSDMGKIGNRVRETIIKITAADISGGLFPDDPNDITQTIPAPLTSGIYPNSMGDLGHIQATTDAIEENYIRALMLMTEQLSAVMMQQVLSIGQFFDAKLQLEAQRTHQELKAEAVKDYHPSEQMCRVGSYVRSLADTEQKASADKLALNDVLMERYKGQDFNSAQTAQIDIETRLKKFREVYCNPKDNNNVLGYMCEHNQDDDLSNSTEFAAPPGGIGGQYDTLTFAGGVNATVTRINKDIDYTRTMDFPQTLDVDFNDGAPANDEEDIIALAKNLYWPNPISYPADKSLQKKEQGYLSTQRVIALKSLAHNSFTNIASLKARAVTPPAGGPAIEPGWTFMKTMIRDFGITDAEVEQMIGVQPSYWAQMDVLTKKIYQDPDFYTNLYDKPVNVDRISVTLDAIKLMQMRDYFSSVQRREMLSSALLETELVRGNHYSQAESGLLFSPRIKK